VKLQRAKPRPAGVGERPQCAAPGRVVDEWTGLVLPTLRELYHRDPELRQVVDTIADGTFSRGDGSLFLPILDSLLSEDPWLVLADFRSYLECQAEVERAYADPERWTRMSILNAARMGQFSSDRSIADYCRDIWRVERVPIELGNDPTA